MQRSWHQQLASSKGHRAHRHRQSLDEDEEDNSSGSNTTADEDIYDHIANLAREYGADYDDEEEAPFPERHKKTITDDTPTSETNDPFSEDDYKEDSEDQQEIQMKVQTRKALKDSKKFLHNTRKMENKLNISQNQSILSNALSKEKNTAYEVTLNQIACKDNWILSTSFDQCFERIRHQIMSDVFNRERLKSNRGKPVLNPQRKSVKVPSKRRISLDIKPLVQPQNFDDIPLPTNKKNFEEQPKRQSKQPNIEVKQTNQKEPRKKQPKEELITISQKENAKRQTQSTKAKFDPYNASESEFNLLESFFGSKRALKILGIGSILVRFQKFYRDYNKYTRNRAVLDLREMWRTTVFEMERAERDHLDTSEYRRQLKYFSAQFCKEMSPQKPFTPGGGKKPSTKDKHIFLHRKQQPTFLKNVKKKKSFSKNSTPTTPDTPTQHPTPNNISPPSNSYSTPARSPPIPREVADFTPPVSQSPRRDPRPSNNEVNYITPKKSKGMRRSLSSRVFKLESRVAEDTPMSEQEQTPFKEVPEHHFTGGSSPGFSESIIQNTPETNSNTVLSGKKNNQSSNPTPNNSRSEENFSTPKSKPSTPMKSSNKENIMVSPIMRKAPPPPIEIDPFEKEFQDGTYEEFQEDSEHLGYSDHSYVDDQDFEDHVEEYDQELSSNTSQMESNFLEQNESPVIENEPTEKQFSFNTSILDEKSTSVNNTSSVSNTNNIEKFSPPFLEEQVKKKAEDLYNKRTGTLGDLLSPRNRQPVHENVQTKSAEEQSVIVGEDPYLTNTERHLKEDKNLLISMQSSSDNIPKPPSRKPPQPTLSLEEFMDRDRTRFAEIEELCFAVDESSIIYQFDKEYVYNGML